MVLNLVVFQEPRGVMRIIQFIFAICAFATTTGFTNVVSITFCDNQVEQLDYDYPFQLDRIEKEVKCNITGNENLHLMGDFSSDARFFVATGVLSMLYCLGIVVVYVLFDALYQANALVPMGDFMLTVLLAVFWLSGSAAWSNGITGLKSVTDSETLLSTDMCKKFKCIYATTGSFFSLNISVILGFLNFFLWASDLWFLYKETQWFKGAVPATASSPGLAAA